jgi:hypothetical protein
MQRVLNHPTMNTTKLSVEIIEFIERPTTQSFLISAQRYIDIIENAKNDNLEEFIEKMQPTLAELYLAGLKLDLIDVKYSNNSKHFQAISDKCFDDIHESLASIFSEYPSTWIASNPMGTGNQRVNINWIDENFEQIYLELKNEITKMNKVATNEAVEDAFWHMKMDYINHWGKEHCINAIQALHYIKYREYSIYTTKLLTQQN